MVYENVLIGNFIFSYGYYLGIKKEPTEDRIVGLFQQTPTDQTISDLFLGAKSRNFIFEFKRDIGKPGKDDEKRKRLICEIDQDKELGALSYGAHFMVGPLTNETAIFAHPYRLSLQDVSKPKGKHLLIGLEKLFQIIETFETRWFFSRSGSPVPAGFSADEVRRYLEILKKIAPNKGGNTEMLIASGHRDGLITFVHARDLEAALELTCNSKEQEPCPEMEPELEPEM